MDTQLNLSTTVKTASAITMAVLSAGFLSIFIKNRLNDKSNGTTGPRKWICVGRVTKLIIYPIKSCTGIELPEGTATKIGLRGLNVSGAEALRDRVFMVVNYRYAMQTQRGLPKLTLIKTEVKDENLVISGPGMESLVISMPENVLANKRSCRVFDDFVREVLDCGDEIGIWLDKFFEGKGYRLVYHALDKTQRIRTPMEAQYPSFIDEDKGTFQDQTAYMIIAEESVVDLNTKLTNAVTFKNFRPTILISGIPEPFAEDLWSYVRIGPPGGPILKTSKPCTRCRLTTVNPETGEFDPEGQPLEALVTTMKRSVENDIVDKLCVNRGLMGISLGLYQEGRNIKVGDPVYAALL